MPDKLRHGLYALIDDSVCPEVDLFERALAALQGGACAIQLRLERSTDRFALELIRRTVDAARPTRTPVLVNDRVDLALVGGAQGVHLGADDLPCEDARRVLGAAAVIGVTSRNHEQITHAAKAGASYVGVGPVFATKTKQVDHAPLGVDGLRALCECSVLPVVAIAGITRANIGEVARAGAHAAAVASGLLEGSGSLVSRVEALERAFSEAR